MEGAVEVDEPGLRAGGRKRTRKQARPVALTKYWGVCRQPSGRYGAQIRVSRGKGHGHTWRWLGTFDHPEDAARAYDAAAVVLRGEAARTNFRQPSGEFIAQKEKAALSLGGCRSPGMWHGHLSVDLQPAERQQVDMDSTDDGEALMEAAATLQQFSLAVAWRWARWLEIRTANHDLRAAASSS